MRKIRKPVQKFFTAIPRVPIRVIRAMQGWNLRSLTIKFFALALFIGSVASIFWYKDVYMTPERRFWSAIDNSMATNSVVRTLESGGSGNQVVQENRFHYSPQNVSESRVEFTNRSATVNTKVITEGISTLESQYSRYVFFETNDAKSDGTIPSLDDVLNQWAGESAEEAQKEEARTAYVSDLVTLAIFGNYDPTYRRTVIDTFKNEETYRINTEGIQETELDGEAVIVFPVSVGLRSYATQLQNSFQRVGLGGFPPLNPENYREDARLNALFTVRKKSNSLVGVQFGERVETYSNYGVLKTVTEPTPVFTPQELEDAVQRQIQG